MYTVALANFYKFFKEKNALSPETAIIPTKEDFLEIGLPGGFGWYLVIPLMSPINKTRDNKYWFSVKYYENNTRNTLIASFLIVGIVFVISILLTLLLGIVTGIRF